jgi:hypothetical protein
MEEERQMKEFQMAQLKQSWAETAARRQFEKSQPPAPDFNPDVAGPASLQKMSGEDADRYERIKKQREQMKIWIQQQISEKQYSKQLDIEENLNYAEMIKMIDEIREATDVEEKQMRKYITDTVKADNLEVLADSRNAALQRTSHVRTPAAAFGHRFELVGHGTEATKSDPEHDQWREQRAPRHLAQLLQRESRDGDRARRQGEAGGHVPGIYGGAAPHHLPAEPGHHPAECVSLPRIFRAARPTFLLNPPQFTCVFSFVFPSIPHENNMNRMAKANGDRLDSEWVMQQMMAVRAMEQVSE